ncbi:NAD(P)/FAD-dependent oxidoreductase [Kribbella turkmenica]|uniref:NAD(P)/FAD-dependent oxidoreductase n=1 Tax=Kribbella turkmenica TaxID=2530375 RepID=A0A4R4X537_9ACTN|nr:NAD(P)/FAD-dependent oxidoreductase [Kribbella turkmenica]TDD25466.1 NAD(P)/FAD-dependent oxidoreductase [Kribbella turkmenica]
MARVIVVGAGLAGLASAVRLAKLGHQVTLCERDERLGGVLGRIEADGFCWDAGAASTTLPAALRDLFRKSGRPIESLVQLEPVAEPRRHMFADGSVLDLPIADRGEQLQAWTELADAKVARQWTALVDGYGETWQILRKTSLEPPLKDQLPLSAIRTLRPWQSLERVAQRRLDDERARAVLRHFAAQSGSDAKLTPGYVGVWSYLERTFGRWTIAGGFGALADALAQRARERKIDVRTGAEVVAVGTSQGSVTGVRLADGTELAADIVVSDIDPRELYEHLVDDPAAKKVRKQVHSTHQAQAAYVVHLGLEDPVPSLPFETVLHGTPTAVVRTGGQAPAGHQAWSVLVHGYPTDDVLDLLVARGLHVRDKVVSRQTSPSWWAGVAWEGYRTARRRAANVSPIKGLYCVGAGAHPGSGVPATTLGAAIVADAVGKA